jgi:superoxide reductase
MSKLGDEIKSADWKAEKHVPVIECADTVNADDSLDVSITIGKEISHPNTTEHHIRWVQLFFKPEGEKSTYEAGNYEFTAHGESTEGANAGPIYTHHTIKTSLNIKKPGTLIATSLCNIHGLWESSREIKIK